MPAFTAEIHRFPGPDGWFYVAVPPEVSAEFPRDRGLSRVRARLGATEWTTSLLPMGDGTQFLPLKAPVRRAERVDLGDEITVEVR